MEREGDWEEVVASGGGGLGRCWSALGEDRVTVLVGFSRVREGEDEGNLGIMDVH